MGIISVEELESRFRKDVSVSQSIPDQAPLKVVDLPPGLQVQSSSSSHHQTLSLRGDPKIKGFMNLYDRDKVAQIHVTQLRTDKPLIEDYYYQAMQRKKSKKEEEGTGGGEILFLPLPQKIMRRKSETAAVETVLRKKPEGEKRLNLGLVSRATSRMPRQRLKLSEAVGTSSSVCIVDGDALVEMTYEALIRVEDGLLLEGETEGLFEELIYALRSETLHLLLDHDKGRRLFGKALRLHLTPLHQRSLLLALCHTLPQLQFIKETGGTGLLPDPRAEQFITLILTPLVPCLLKLTWLDLFGALDVLLSDPDFMPWVCKTKPGLVLLCLILSRLELLRSEKDTSTLTKQYTEAYIPSLWSRLSEHLLEFFAFQTGPSHSYYIWQLFALIAIHLEDEARREMLVELREKILAMVEEWRMPEIEHLNIFLHVLGMDAEQLK